MYIAYIWSEIEFYGDTSAEQQNVISECISDDTHCQKKILNMVILIQNLYFASNRSVASRIYEAVCHPAKCSDSISQDIPSKTFDVIQSNIALQKPKSIRNDI